jgi:DNA-binding transcriptional MocR family regulator
MRLPLSWTPQLPPGTDPLYRRLFRALEQDITSGVLAAGLRLPTHRDLAYRLNVSVATATKAYAEAERRGLIASHVGRGSFVSGASASITAASPGERIDLSRNLPPLLHASRHLTDGLIALAGEARAGGFLDYAPVEGAEAYRRAAASWISRTASFGEVDWRRLILCNGAQHALDLIFSSACSPGDLVLCEAAIYPGMKAIAAQRGLRLRGISLDAEGLEPAALERAATRKGARLLYTTPTLQNPTARIMGEARRRAIVELAREHDLLIVEDDICASYANATQAVFPLAAMAPERSFYVSSASKAIAPGLRAGWLLPPRDGEWRERILARLRTSALALPAFGHALMARWIEDGTADRIGAAIREEMRQRLDAARRILGDRIEAPSVAAALHVWAPLAPVEAERCVARAMEKGIALTPPSAIIVDTGATSGLRICLGGAPDIATLESALRILARALSGESGRLEQSAL